MTRAATSGHGSIDWYIKRLRSMGPREILHRVSERAKKSASRRRHQGWAPFVDVATTLPVLPSIREAASSADNETREAIRRAAGAVLDGRFEALGAAWPKRAPEALFPADIWRLDPVTGGLWPGKDVYTFDIGYRRERTLGDVKYVWEFQRLQFLQPLAASVCLTGDATALAAIEEAIASWYEANPPFMGIAWNSGIELALRAISLLLVTSLCGEALSAETVTRVRTILGAHAYWLARFPSRFSSANNHLIAELAGEFLIAVAIPGLAKPAASARAAGAGLAREILDQILPDGVGAEQSPTYAAFSVELVLLAAKVGRAAGHPLPREADERLARFIDFVAWIANPDGTLPAIGDDDEGRVIALGGPEPGYATSVASGAAGYLGVPGPVAKDATLRGAVFGPPAAVLAAPSGLHTFDTGGYSVFRGEQGAKEILLVLDHGPLGYLSIAAHGHADALSVILSIDGEPVLVDPGTFAYHAGGAWRDWFRGTRAHNTLAVGDADQSIIAGAFNWSHKARAKLDERIEGAEWRLRASHDGYQGRFGKRHERMLAAAADGIHIVDRLIGPGGAADAEVTFQLAAELKAKVDGKAVSVTGARGTVLRIVCPDDAVSIARGGEEASGGGWVSPSFGTRQPADRISWRGRVGEEGVRFLLEI